MTYLYFSSLFHDCASGNGRIGHLTDLLDDLLKETKSETMNIFRKIVFSKNGVCKSRIKSGFHNKSVYYS